MSERTGQVPSEVAGTGQVSGRVSGQVLGQVSGQVSGQGQRSASPAAASAQRNQHCVGEGRAGADPEGHLVEQLRDGLVMLALQARHDKQRGARHLAV